MKDKVFVDSNILIYLFSKDNKKDVAKKILKEKPDISTQVLNEISNVLHKKLQIEIPSILESIEKISTICKVRPISTSTIKQALNIADRYKYSYYDSLIISSALENKCSILYSEDMHEGQVIDKFLKIENPFIRDVSENKF